MTTNKVDVTNPCLNDIGAERAVLSAILTHGADALLDMEDILGTNDFYGQHHGKLFTILKYLAHDKGATSFDVPTILAKASALGFEHFIGKGKDEEYLHSLFTESVSLDNARSLAVVVFKLSVGRQAYQCTREIQQTLKGITGDEDITSILAMVEDPVFKFSGEVVSKDSTLVGMGDEFQTIMDALASDPKDIIGLPTGFQMHDMAVGGGLRPGGITVVGARPKIGKSFYCLNVGYNVASASIPVLYLDTELPYKWQLMRLTSLISGVELDRIETGQFVASAEESKAVWGIGPDITKLPFTHCSIAGQSIAVVLSLVRRWLAKKVGFTANGKAKPCVVLYDYLKLMDSKDLTKNLAEFQVLGFLLTQLHNFALKYDVPILATVQLNRDGGDREEGNVISGSDRILWLASSFSILKRKSPEELQEDPPSNGDRKLVVTDTRFGPGMSSGDYVNVKADLARARMSEGPAFSQEMAQKFPGNEKK